MIPPTVPELVFAPAAERLQRETGTGRRLSTAEVRWAQAGAGGRRLGLLDSGASY